jgi:hypothetical protein
MTIAITTRRLEVPAHVTTPRRRSRRLLKRVLITSASVVVGLVALVAAFVGYSIWRIDHDVHHVAVPASLLAKGKDDLLAVVEGPQHFEQVFVFHTTATRTNVLKVPASLAIPVAGGRTVPLSSLSLHAPDALIGGLEKLGIPVSRYVGVDLHMVSPTSNLGLLATGKLSVTSLISDPTGTSSLLQQVASHIYLAPGTPVSAVLNLMHVPTANPVSVPTDRDSSGNVVLASAFTSVLRTFL